MTDLAGLAALAQDWWFSVLGYGVMAFVVVEALNDAALATRVQREVAAFDRRARIAHEAPAETEFGRQYPGIGVSLAREAVEMAGLRKRIADFHDTTRSVAEERLVMWTNIAPLLGLLFTAMQLAIALPTAFEVIQTEPAAFFRSIGVAVGSTAMGVFATICAILALHRLDAASAALERTLQRKDP